MKIVCQFNSPIICLLQDEPIQQGCDGSFGSRQMFKCSPNHGVFTQLANVVKQEDFFFANPGRNNQCKSILEKRLKYNFNLHEC